MSAFEARQTIARSVNDALEDRLRLKARRPNETIITTLPLLRVGCTKLDHPARPLISWRTRFEAMQMVFTVFYVSRSLLHGTEASAHVQDIIDRSTRWNASMGVTGALAFTERHFAQSIEGDEDTIRALMARIENDQRHTNVTIRRARPETD